MNVVQTNSYRSFNVGQWYQNTLNLTKYHKAHHCKRHNKNSILLLATSIRAKTKRKDIETHLTCTIRCRDDIENFKVEKKLRRLKSQQRSLS